MKTVEIQGGSMTWLMDDSIELGANVSLAEMFVRPGETSELHRHGNCNEVIHLVSGHIRQRIGDVWIDMEAGDTRLIPKGEMHQTKNNGSTEAKLILVYSAGKREYETG